MNYRIATAIDCPLLAELNHQLIEDEGHRNPMSFPELQHRMKRWLSENYTAVLFEESEEIYLRHLFVIQSRRRKGIGRKAMEILRSRIWPADKRLTVSVLTSNEPATAFWRAIGYHDYSLTLEILPEMKRLRSE